MSAAYLIEHACPQCGAPATLEETDRLFSCGFCRVKSYLVEKGYFQYLFPSRAPRGKQLIYFPYWRYKGMYFSCSPDGIHHRVMDFSYSAVASPHFPISVGLRSQALTLRFVSAGVAGHFVRPSIPPAQVMGIFDRRLTGRLPKPILLQAHIGESFSLIYAPFYAGKKLYDGILNQPISAELPGDFHIDGLPGGPPRWQVRFVPTLCPNCGWDMEGGRDCLVLRCRNCTSLWRSTRNGLKRMPFAHIPTIDGGVVYLPFWRIHAGVTGLALRSYADLVKAANLPKVPRPEWEHIDFRFWSPAFKVRPETFLRLATHLTLSQPPAALETTLPAGNIYPVNLALTEAVEGLKLTLANFLKPKERLIDLLADIEIRPVGFLLVYIPFVEKHHDLIQPTYRVAVNKNQLRLSGNL